MENDQLVALVNVLSEIRDELVALRRMLDGSNPNSFGSALVKRLDDIDEAIRKT